MSRERSNRPSASCGSCGSHLIHPTRELQAGSSLWEVELRCADCDELEVTYCTEAELETLDRDQDRAASEIQEELGRLEALHMKEWVSRFEHALELDLIGPDDF